MTHRYHFIEQEPGDEKRYRESQKALSAMFPNQERLRASSQAAGAFWQGVKAVCVWLGTLALFAFLVWLMCGGWAVVAVWIMERIGK